mmetsp:Transcript_1744/g.3830  ORF Transcript_1744/g.3830 Transcript_1744/m.3830 type:complete len:234 (+) Transcript_1744:495-1196(+)
MLRALTSLVQALAYQLGQHKSDGTPRGRQSPLGQVIQKRPVRVLLNVLRWGFGPLGQQLRMFERGELRLEHLVIKLHHLSTLGHHSGVNFVLPHPQQMAEEPKRPPASDAGIAIGDTGTGSTIVVCCRLRVVSQPHSLDDSRRRVRLDALREERIQPRDEAVRPIVEVRPGAAQCGIALVVRGVEVAGVRRPEAGQGLLLHVGQAHQGRLEASSSSSSRCRRRRHTRSLLPSY